MIKSIKETFELKLKKYSFLSIFLILIFSNFSIADENSKNFVGFIDTLDGKAAKGSDENLVELNEFDQIFINDKIKTDKDSLITISFNDNSLLTLKGESEFYVQEFDKNSSTQKFILSIPNGKFSFESGTIAKSKKGVMKIKLSGLDVKLTGTLTVGQNFEGNKSVTLIEDSMGNLGKLEVGLEGSNETKIIDLGERLVEIKAWKTGHTDNDLSIYDKKTKTFWSENIFVKRTPSIRASILGWRKNLEEISKMEIKLIIPGHGKAVDKEKAIKPMINYFDRIIVKLRELQKNKKSLQESINIILQESILEPSEVNKENWILFDEYHYSNITKAFTELEWE